MITTRVKATALSVVLLAFAMALFLQQATINRLRAEAGDLRVQLSQAAAAGENRRSLKLLPRTDHVPAKDEVRELLRLRGEVGVLRRQLADALRVAPKEENLAAPDQSLGRPKSGLAALDAALTAQQGRVDAGKQKAEQLLTALNVPEDLARMDEDAMANLSSESMEYYRPYFQAKRELESLERFTAILKIKMNAERHDAQEDAPRSSAP
jgi:hypothetical protein